MGQCLGDLGSTLARRGRLCRQEKLVVENAPQGQTGAG